jgi:uncharacterized cysteine cluster protein YcgN (CxxCxxCC family)
MTEIPAAPFWETKQLSQMNQSEWESLCDGCGHCCLVKIEDEDTGELFETNVACRMLDIETCRCRVYQDRFAQVSTCLRLEPDQQELFHYLPETCAYRCLAEGRPLPSWHPLKTGDRKSVHEAGVSVTMYALSEIYIHPEQLPQHIINQLK